MTIKKESDTESHAGESSAEGRTIFFTGDVNESLVKDAIQSIFQYAESNASKPIYLVVNTYGGSVDETFALYDAIKMSPAPVRTIGLGKIMSAGCLILAAGQKGYRRMGKNSRLMMHGGWELIHGDIFAVENDLIEFKRQEYLYNQLLAKECKKTVKQVEALYKAKRMDRYMTPEQCLKFGFVDMLS